MNSAAGFRSLFSRRQGLAMPLALAILVSALGTGCQRRLPDPAVTVQSLQKLQQLATVSYEVSKVVKANDNLTWYKVGDRKILLTCHATIKAGIDLGKIKPEDIDVSGRKITLRLPPPEIISVNLPPNNIRVAYQDVGIFRSDFTGQEIDLLMAQAEKQMWAAGASLGITDQAKVNTQLAVSKLLTTLGYEEVFLTFDKPTQPAAR
jgi:hypothetical protein